MSEYIIQGDTLTAIADAIREKTETSDMVAAADMARLISNIGADYVSGTITLSANATSMTIEHNLGRKPVIMVIWHYSTSVYTMENGTAYQMYMNIACADGTQFYANYSGGKPNMKTFDDCSMYSTTAHSLKGFIYGVNETTASLGRLASSAFFPSGVTYKWVVI